jgi:hypothetical protein
MIDDVSRAPAARVQAEVRHRAKSGTRCKKQGSSQRQEFQNYGRHPYLP